MRSLLLNHKAATLLFCILISIYVIYQSSFFRWIGYETMPTPITDEFNYAWQGLSLREHGLPLGWVTFTHIYRDEKLNPKGGNLKGFGVVSGNTLVDLSKFKQDSRPIVAIEQIDYIKGKEHMFFVAPFFDHPPLGGLIYSLGETSNIKDVEHVKAAEFRRPALVLAIITAVLLFIFLYIISFNPWVAVLGVGIYSTVPTYLLATRTAFLENVVPPFILTHLILLLLATKIHQKKSNSIFATLSFILSGIFAGLGFLAKEPAIGFFLGSLILTFINKVPRKLIVAFFISGLIPILLYFSWGLWLQKDLFLDVLMANATRGYFGAIKPVTMLEALRLKGFPIDGWWFYGFLSFLLISLNTKNKLQLFLLLPLFTHYLTILLMGSENYGWYLISMIPFLAGCSAIAIWNVYENPTVPTAYAFFFIAFSSSYYWGRITLNLPQDIMHYRGLFLIFTLFLFLRLVLSKYKVTKVIWFIFLAYLVFRSLRYNEIFLTYIIANKGILPIPGPVIF